MKLFLYNLAALLALSTAAFAQSADSTIHSYIRFSTRQLYSPASLILGGLIANGHSEESIKHELVEERNEMIPHFKTRLDGYLQFSPLAAYWTHRYKWGKDGIRPLRIRLKLDYQHLQVNLLLLVQRILAIRRVVAVRFE